MVTVLVSVEIPAPRERVWNELARLENHVTWMMDATAIRFQGEQRSGIGTRFECDTTFGPLHLTDLMEVTEWEYGESIGVRHSGAVSGSGRFSLREAPGSATMVDWEERLVFPFWLGAKLGAQLAKPVFTAMWKGNLRRLGQRVTELPSSRK